MEQFQTKIIQTEQFLKKSKVQRLQNLKKVKGIYKSLQQKQDPTLSNPYANCLDRAQKSIKFFSNSQFTKAVQQLSINQKLDVFKKKVNRYQQQLKKIQLVIQAGCGKIKLGKKVNFNVKNDYSPFKIPRGACKFCISCNQYVSSNNILYFQNIFNENLNINCQCGCPMNGHYPLSTPIQPLIRKQLYKFISYNITQKNLKNQLCLLTFDIELNQLQDFQTQNQLRKYLQKKYSNIIMKLSQYLNSLNFNIIRHNFFSKYQYQLSIIKNQIIQTSSINKQQQQNLLTMCNIDTLQYLQKIKDIKQDKQIGIYQKIYKIIQKLRKQTFIQQSSNKKRKKYHLVFLGSYFYQHQVLIQYLYQQQKNNKSIIQIPKSFQIDNHPIFTYGTIEKIQATLLSQFLFPQLYVIKYDGFILPGLIPQKQQDIKNKFKLQKYKYQYQHSLLLDQLSLNNTHPLNLKINLDKKKAQQVLQKSMKFSQNKVNYILGPQQFKDNIIFPLQICMSPSPKNVIINQNTLDYIHLKHKDMKQILPLLNTNLTDSQRVVFILKPCLTKQLKQIIIGTMRCNKMIIIKRINYKLNQQQAKYIAVIQSHPQSTMQSYINYLTSGVCQIVLASSIGAIYQGWIIANGVPQSPTQPILNHNNNQIKKVKNKNSGVQFQQQLPIKKQSIFKFEGVSKMIDLQSALFPKSQTKYLVNSLNGQVIKINSVQQNKINKLDISKNIKLQILREYHRSQQNMFVYSSKSQRLTQQLVGLFMPQCGLFQPVTLIVKPTFIHLVSKLRQNLLKNKFHIIHQKQYKMRKQQVQQLIYSNSKFKKSNIDFQYIHQYINKPIYIFIVSKVSGKKQILSMLSQFSFRTKYQFQQIIKINEQSINQIIIPIWNNQHQINSFIDSCLGNIKQSINKLLLLNHYQLNNMQKKKKHILINYLSGAYFGVQADQQFNTKLGKFVYYQTSYQIAILQSWYYSQISKIGYGLINNRSSAMHVPLIFQYRYHQLSLSLPFKSSNKKVFVIQSNNGNQFLNYFKKLYQQAQNKIRQKLKRDQFKNNYKLKNKKKRGNIVAFLFIKKLLQMAQNISIEITKLLNFSQNKGNYTGIGQIQLNQNSNMLKGKYQISQYINQQQILLKQKITQFSKNIQKNQQEQSYQIIIENIKKLLNSRHQKLRFENRKLIPSIENIQQNQNFYQKYLRIFQLVPLTKLTLMDKYNFIDPDYQLSNYGQLQQMWGLGVWDVVPKISTKYQLLAFLYVQLQYLKQKQNINSQMIQQMIKIMQQLFQNKQDIDQLEFQIYLYKIKKYNLMSNQNKLNYIQSLKKYPYLKNIKTQNRLLKIQDDKVGKFRKFIPHQQYFKRSQLTDQIKQKNNKKYNNFDLYTLIQQPSQKTAIYDPQNQLHRHLVHRQKRINLLRQPKQQLQINKVRQGVYVQYQKTITQKQLKHKKQIQNQVKIFNETQNNQGYMKQNGLQKQLWYLKSKIQPNSPSRKTQNAINKQIQKFRSFQSMNKESK